MPAHLEADPGTVALLHDLQRKSVPLYYLSNMPAPYADHLERQHDFLSCFENGLFSARVGLIKPEPAIFARAALDFGIEPAHSLFIDDHAANIAAARALGWQALRFVSAEDCAAELRGSGWL